MQKENLFHGMCLDVRNGNGGNWKLKINIKPAVTKLNMVLLWVEFFLENIELNRTWLLEPVKESNKD